MNSWYPVERRKARRWREVEAAVQGTISSLNTLQTVCAPSISSDKLPLEHQQRVRGVLLSRRCRKGGVSLQWWHFDLDIDVKVCRCSHQSYGRFCRRRSLSPAAEAAAECRGGRSPIGIGIGRFTELSFEEEDFKFPG